MAFVASTTGQDREDFVGTEALNAAPLWRNLSGTINNSETTGLFDVRRWPYLQFVAFNLTAARTMFILVQWFDDPATLNIIGTVNYTTQLGSRIVDSTPNLGPYCLVTVFWDDSGNHAATCIIMGRNHPAISGIGDGGAAQFGTQVLAARSIAPIGAGINVAQSCDFVQAGWATLSVETNAIGIIFVMQTLRSDGVFIRTGPAIVMTAAGAPLSVIQHIAVGTQLLQLNAFNSTGAPVSCGWGLIMGPTR